MKVLQFVSESMTGMVFTLMVAAGLLSRYWDAPVFHFKGQGTDAKFARAVGLGLLIAGPTLYVVKTVTRHIMR